MFSRIAVRAKQISLVLGAITAIFAVYVNVGGPIPVSEAAVNVKISPIFGALNDLRSTQKIILGDLSSLQRATLRNERFALERALETAPANTKATLTIRLAQIADEIAKIDERDKLVRDKLTKDQ